MNSLFLKRTFWGSLLIMVGILWLTENIFNLDIPVFRILISLTLIIIGFALIKGWRFTRMEGSQTLFGASTQLKFGNTMVDLIAASSKGKRDEINITGKAQVQEFELSADNYEVNKHYFVNLYHHDHYDQSMATLPIVNTTVNITRMEVWLTNRTNNTDNTRNIIAFTDLGEAIPENIQGNPGSLASSELPDNDANGLYAWASGQPLVRGFVNAVSVLSSQGTSPGPFQQAFDYEKVQNARKLGEQEFSYNAQLGFISLNQPLNTDEVLAVAYEYTYRGETYQVGEFSTDGIAGQEALILKLLKPTIINPQNKLWALMMKNVYAIGAYQVDKQGFRLNLLYNNPETPPGEHKLAYEFDTMVFQEDTYYVRLIIDGQIKINFKMNPRRS